MVVVFFPFSLFFEGKKAENDAIGHATSVFVRSFFLKKGSSSNLENFDFNEIFFFFIYYM